MLLIAAIGLAIFVLPDAWAVPVIGGAVAIEVVETAFWIRLSQRGRARVGPETMIGSTALVVTACEPVGTVRLRGELWRARCRNGALAGETVRVREIDGLTLVVERLTDPADAGR